MMIGEVCWDLFHKATGINPNKVPLDFIQSAIERNNIICYISFFLKPTDAKLFDNGCRLRGYGCAKPEERGALVAIIVVA
jgi:hypothetical protein